MITARNLNANIFINSRLIIAILVRAESAQQALRIALNGCLESGVAGAQKLTVDMG